MMDIRIDRPLSVTYNGHAELNDAGERALRNLWREAKEFVKAYPVELSDELSLSQLVAVTDAVSEIFPDATFTVCDGMGFWPCEAVDYALDKIAGIAATGHTDLGTAFGVTIETRFANQLVEGEGK